MIRLGQTLSLLLLVGLTLAGCNTPPPHPTFPDIRFASDRPIRLDVARVEVVQAYQPTYKEPNVEHLFPVAPAHAMANWANDRLRGVGAQKIARFTIVDATVRETALAKTQGIRGAFTTDQAARYDATVEAKLDILNERGFPEHTSTAKVSRSQTVPEGITPNDRDKVWYDMTKALMDDFDRAMEADVRANFGYAVQ
jgi:hypothetical protein